MPPRERRNSAAMMALRRVGTEPMNSLVKVGAKYELASAMTRMIFRNIHLAIMRRDEPVELNSTENSYAPEQRDGEAPVQRWVRVAMKPDDTPMGKGHWSESGTKNWENVSEKWDKRGLSSMVENSKRAKKPAFVLREIEYDEWRNHYAKDKYGKYRGLKEPAANCILTPEDEIKWRSPKPETEAGPSTAEPEETIPSMVEIKRAATFPEYTEVDSVPPMDKEQDLAVGAQKEEAVFIEEDGHAASKMVDENKVSLTSPLASPTTASPARPMSPMALDHSASAPEMTEVRRL